MKTHRDLDVWKDSMNLIVEIYKITEKFPKEELNGLISQIRRSSVSVAVNISEGAGRRTPKELRKFLYFSFGSLSELETLFQIAVRLGYLDDKTWKGLQVRVQKITAQLSGLIKSIKVVD